MKWNKKPCLTTKKVIDSGKRSKTLSEVKLVENISKNLRSFLEINPMQKEVLLSRKLQDHAFSFFNCYLAVPWPTLGHCRGDSLTNPILITAFSTFRPEGYQEPHNEVGSLSPTEHLVGFELGTF